MTSRTRLPRRRHRVAGVAVAAALGWSAACSGGGDADPPATADTQTGGPTDSAPDTAADTPVTAPPTPSTPPSTAPGASTTAGTTAATTATPPPTTAAPTTTTEPGVARMPLTGVPLAFGQLPPDRPAMVVKIDNVGRAKPQTGLNQADIVFEEIVEGRATRFAAVFHSTGSNPVGPIRSGRTQDVDLLSGLNQPIFVWSGGNPGVVAAIANSDFLSINATGRPPALGFFRSSRPRPHNLYNNTDFLWGMMTLASGRPTGLLDYLEAGEGPRGDNRSWVEVRVGINRIRWEWSPETQTWLRTENGRPHTLTDGRAAAPNVVVLVTPYRPSSVDARSPEAITVGTGIAYVFSAGKMQIGTWRREARTDGINLATVDGAPIEIGPGRTWVELADIVDHNTRTG